MKSKKKIYLYIFLIIVFGFSGFFVWKYLKVSEQMLACHSYAETSDYVVKAIPFNGQLLTVTSSGGIQCFDSSGKTVFSENAGARIFDLTISDDQSQFSIASSSFIVYDRNGNEVFTKAIENFLPVKAQFISDSKYKLLYQSLTDFSYKAITVDKTGKTLLTEDIPDLGEPSSVDISSSGKILFVGERGEVYIIENNAKTMSTYIEKTSTSVHNVFGYFVSPDTIMIGYKNTADESLKLPVYFFDLSLKEINSISFSSNINNIFIGKEMITFALDSGFEFYNIKGEQVKSVDEVNFSALFFSENNYYKVYVFYKKPEKENDKPIYKIILKDSQENTVGNYLEAYDYPPYIILSDTDKKVFIITGSKIECLYK